MYIELVNVENENCTAVGCIHILIRKAMNTRRLKYPGHVLGMRTYTKIKGQNYNSGHF